MCAKLGLEAIPIPVDHPEPPLPDGPSHPWQGADDDHHHDERDGDGDGAYGREGHDATVPAALGVRHRADLSPGVVRAGRRAARMRAHSRDTGAPHCRAGAAPRASRRGCTR
jgi:hypothetical protein